MDFLLSLVDKDLVMTTAPKHLEMSAPILAFAHFPIQYFLSAASIFSMAYLSAVRGIV